MRDFKYQITPQLTFHKEIEIENNETTYPSPIYLNSNTQTVINDSDITDSLKISYQIILSKV